MAKRTIGVGVGTYMRTDGVWHFGCLGESVDVHESDLERFDRLNTAGAHTPVVEDVPPVEPDHVSVEADGPILEVARPARAASKSLWVEYAVFRGLDQAEAEALTRDQLAEQLGE